MAKNAIERRIDRIAGIAQRRDELPVQILVILNNQDAHRLPRSLANSGQDYNGGARFILVVRPLAARPQPRSTSVLKPP